MFANAVGGKGLARREIVRRWPCLRGLTPRMLKLMPAAAADQRTGATALDAVPTPAVNRPVVEWIAEAPLHRGDRGSRHG